MTQPAIKAEGLSKRYHIGGRRSYDTLRDKIMDAVTSPIRSLRRFGRSSHREEDTIWALKDVSFEVEPGEVVGIIGRNGAGKSTLLKILTRITHPTAGRAELRGRVGSLLEVGTGFHHELSGRENIFLSGAILGMGRQETKARFDEIVDFSGVEKFIDTPVKRYSSGMRVRLGFAVAAHLQPEILLIDEVLAVGDAEFQKKCLGKMGDVARGGRTVLFVSHNMAAIENLCGRAIVLHDGRVRYIGSQTDAITQYMTSLSGAEDSLRDRKGRVGSGEVQVVAVEIRDEKKRPLEMVRSGQSVDIYLRFERQPDIDVSGVIASVSVTTQMNAPVFLQHNRLTRDDFGDLPERGAFVCHIDRLPLPQGSYILSCSLIRNGSYLDALPGVAPLTVIEGDFFGSGEVPPIGHGVCLVDARWRLEV